MASPFASSTGLTVFCFFIRTCRLCFFIRTTMSQSSVSERKNYEYDSLRSSNSTEDVVRFMVLENSSSFASPLRCRVITQLLQSGSGSSTAEYVALSYTCGQPIYESELLADGDAVIPITRNLELALRRIRLDCTEPLMIWVDAVSINQKDIEERSRQARLIGKIYSQAKPVMVWLGEDDEMRSGGHCLHRLWEIAAAAPWSIPKTTDPFWLKTYQDSRNLEMKLRDCRVPSENPGFSAGLHRTQRNHPDAQSTSQFLRNQIVDNFTARNTSNAALVQRVTPDDYDMIQMFLSKAYFSRRWFVQEVYLAAVSDRGNIAFYCGDICLSGSTIFLALGDLRDHTELSRTPEVTSLITPVLRMMDDQGLLSRKTPVGWLQDFLHFKCSDARDHVFSQLAVFGTMMLPAVETRFKNVSYMSSVSAVYTALAEYQLDCQRDIRYCVAELLAVSSALGCMGISDPVPSWVPDWRQGAKFHVSPFIDGQPSFRPMASTCHPGPAAEDRQLSPSGVKHQDAALAASRHPTIPGCLNLWGLQVDVVHDVVDTDLTTPAGIRLLWERISKWECNRYYQSVCGSLKATVSEALVTYSFHCEGQAPGFYGHVKWCQSAVLDALESGEPVYEIEKFREALHKTMKGRSIFYTRDGCIGVAGRESKPGDVVVAIVDSPRPFIFRKEALFPLDKRTHSTVDPTPLHPYRVISDSYIHGFDVCGLSRLAPELMFLV